MMQRTSVIVSGMASLPEPTLRDLSRHSSTLTTYLWSDNLWEICVAKINILQSKSGAFTTFWIALVAVKTHEDVYSRIGSKRSPPSSEPNAGSDQTINREHRYEGYWNKPC
jgi:hypothetical protein